MVSYKPKKKKTNEEILIDRLIKKIIWKFVLNIKKILLIKHN
jgi:hypothetical protein